MDALMEVKSKNVYRKISMKNNGTLYTKCVVVKISTDKLFNKAEPK